MLYLLALATPPGTVPLVIRLVLAEKPSVAKDIATALADEGFSRTQWGFASETTWITAAAGHLVSELPPDGYDERWKVWDFDALPMIPERFLYQARDQRAAERLRAIKALLADDRVGRVVIATDAGREGELIARLILQSARGAADTKTIERAWFASMTPDAIRAAFEALRSDEEMRPLEAAARCRAESDWLVGMNETRGASTRLGGGRQLISLGRVQTPTLALVVRRDLEIEAFEPVNFATLEAAFTVGDETYTGEWRSSDQADASSRFDLEEDAARVARAVQQAGVGTIVSVESNAEVHKPPTLHDLTSLQREANSRLGLSAAETLEVAQRLYEHHAVLSYPRTDSSFITADDQPLIPKILTALSANPSFSTAVAELTGAGADGTVLVNDAGVSDHHGLLPVANRNAIDLSALTERERDIFDLVTWRMIGALAPAHEVTRTTVFTSVATSDGPELFRSSGKVIIEEGWRRWLPLESDTTVALPALSEGESAVVSGSEVKQSKTKPPARLTEAALLGAMATAGKYLDDELAEAMKDSGLGTPATRAATIEKLLKVGYIERQKKALVATAKGRGVVLALGEHPLTSAELTGQWERRLREIERCNPVDAGSLRESFMADAKAFTSEIVASLQDGQPSQLLAGRIKLADCPNPECNGGIVAGARGWGCDSWKSREEPGCGVVIWRDEPGAKRKLTEKAMLKRVAEMAAGKQPLPAKPVPAETIAACPNEGCSGSIVMRAKAFSCDSWKSKDSPGCGFVIWRNEGRDDEVSREAALEMIARGESDQPQVFAKCPAEKCRGKLIAHKKVIACDTNRPGGRGGCGTKAFRFERDGTAKTEEQLRQELFGG